MPARPIELLEQAVFCQHDFEGQRVFQHRTRAKWGLWRVNRRIQDFWYEAECLGYLDELRGVWNGEIKIL